MGLDSWFFAKSKDDTNEESLGYGAGHFRNHHDLHGWIANEVGDDGFNGAYELSLEQLNRLLSDVEGDRLPFTKGFFFGYVNTDEYKSETIEVLEECIQLAEEGLTITYMCWW